MVAINKSVIQKEPAVQENRFEKLINGFKEYCDGKYSPDMFQCRTMDNEVFIQSVLACTHAYEMGLINETEMLHLTDICGGYNEADALEQHYIGFQFQLLFDLIETHRMEAAIEKFRNAIARILRGE